MLQRDRWTREHGEFITLDEALKDASYQTASHYVGPYGSPWQHSWTIVFGKKSDLENASDPPKWVLEMYNEATKPK